MSGFHRLPKLKQVVARIRVGQFRRRAIDVATQFVTTTRWKGAARGMVHRARSAGKRRTSARSAWRHHPYRPDWHGHHEAVTLATGSRDQRPQADCCSAQRTSRFPAGTSSAEHRQPPAGETAEKRPGRVAGRHRGESAVHRRQRVRRPAPSLFILALRRYAGCVTHRPALTTASCANRRPAR